MHSPRSVLNITNTCACISRVTALTLNTLFAGTGGAQHGGLALLRGECFLRSPMRLCLRVQRGPGQTLQGQDIHGCLFALSLTDS